MIQNRVISSLTQSLSLLDLIQMHNEPNSFWQRRDNFIIVDLLENSQAIEGDWPSQSSIDTCTHQSNPLVFEIRLDLWVWWSFLVHPLVNNNDESAKEGLDIIKFNLVISYERIICAPHPVIFFGEPLHAGNRMCIEQGSVDHNQIVCRRRLFAWDSHEFCEGAGELDVESVDIARAPSLEDEFIHRGKVVMIGVRVVNHRQFVGEVLQVFHAQSPWGTAAIVDVWKRKCRLKSERPATKNATIPHSELILSVPPELIDNHGIIAPILLGEKKLLSSRCGRWNILVNWGHFLRSTRNVEHRVHKIAHCAKSWEKEENSRFVWMVDGWMDRYGGDGDGDADEDERRRSWRETSNILSVHVSSG